MATENLSVSPSGLKNFQEHLQTIQQYIKQVNKKGWPQAELKVPFRKLVREP